jgi:hypothetical protein
VGSHGVKPATLIALNRKEPENPDFNRLSAKKPGLGGRDSAF